VDWRQFIERKPGVLGGKPIIKGTRISVQLILERLGDGWTEAQLLNAYPHLTSEHIRAAQAYAAAALSTDDVIVVE
jgi:uncharacterized protein (DUF433 family)